MDNSTRLGQICFTKYYIVIAKRQRTMIHCVYITDIGDVDKLCISREVIHNSSTSLWITRWKIFSFQALTLCVGRGIIKIYFKEVSMNRQQRREFNRRNKTNYTKRDFDLAELYEMLKSGRMDSSTLMKYKELLGEDVAFDSEFLVPNGMPVKINTPHIMSRPRKDLSEEYLDWVSWHGDEVFHVQREDGKRSLVALREDVEEKRESNSGFPWLFDIYSDLLYYDKEEKKWKMLKDFESAEMETRAAHDDGEFE